MAAAAPLQTLGRFQLKQVLGRGAQGTVWLATDPLLEREVAIKQMRSPAPDDKALQRWLGEARAVSRLSHPHIVPVFEADVDAGQPYLVFELVAGQTLADYLQDHGALQGEKAVELMLGVLSGLHHAHEAEVIHRDLKPSNILLGGNGVPRVMDFGMAFAGKTEAPDPGLMGTIAYMAPESLSGGKPSPAMDIFSAGLVFYEMLTGQQAVTETDPYRVIYRLAHEDFALPANLPHPLDDALRSIVNRALARDLSVRYSSAKAMHQALAEWMQPKLQDDVGAVTTGSGTLEFLLRRMQHKSDFPALSDSISRIQKISQSDDENIHSLANEILKDVALTNKILRLVNSSYYSAVGGGSISTVSRAVALIGFTGIRNLALSLVLLEHMQDKKNITVLREEFFRSVMAGIVANEICTIAKEAEEAFITASFQNLGRLLTQYYFPEEADQIRRRLIPTATPGRPGLNQSASPSSGVASFAEEERAATTILGISFQNLGVGVAKHWGLPDTLTAAMRRLPSTGMVHAPAHAPERLRALASAGNEITEALLCSDEEESKRRLVEVSERYAHALKVNLKSVKESLGRAQERLTEVAQSLAIPVLPGSNASRLLGHALKNNAGGQDASTTDGLQSNRLENRVEHSAQTSSAQSPSEATQAMAAMVESGHVAERLASGIQDVSNSLVEDSFKLHEVLRMILETLLRALDFQRVVFCLRDPRTGNLTGRFALGLDAEKIAPRFQIKMGAAQDLFSAVCVKGADLLIADASAPNVASRIPTWFSEGVKAPTFLLLPLVIKGAPMGLIYADRAVAGSIRIQERELSLLRTLRNQAVMAFKQAHKG